MSRVALLYGEETLLDEYNNIVAEKLNEKSFETMGKSSSSIGFTRGIRQMMEDIATYDPNNTYLGNNSYSGGLLDIKKHFYRLISLLLSDLGLVFDIRFPSPWQVIPELRNRDIIGESDYVNLKVCLSIANEIRVEAYFANVGQKELYSPLLQIPDTAKQSTENPIFRKLDEDTLVRLLSTAADLHQRCRTFALKYVKQDEVDASILGKHASVPYSKAWLMAAHYVRLQKYPKAFEYLNSITEDSPDYAYTANIRGCHCAYKRERKEAIGYFETSLKYSQVSFYDLIFLQNLAQCLIECSEFKKAKNKIMEAMKLHDKIYGKGCETMILSQLLLLLGAHFIAIVDMPSAIETLQRVEEMQKRMTHCRDIDVIRRNLYMASSYSKLFQNDRALDYLERALCLSHKIFGENNINHQLAEIYVYAASVYSNCNQHQDALAMLERCLKLMKSLHGDTANASKIVVAIKILLVKLCGNTT